LATSYDSLNLDDMDIAITDLRGAADEVFTIHDEEINPALEKLPDRCE